jgi:hypothetical protein
MFLDLAMEYSPYKQLKTALFTSVTIYLMVYGGIQNE